MPHKPLEFIPGEDIGDDKDPNIVNTWIAQTFHGYFAMEEVKTSFISYDMKVMLRLTSNALNSNRHGSLPETYFVLRATVEDDYWAPCGWHIKKYLLEEIAQNIVNADLMRYHQRYRKWETE